MVAELGAGSDELDIDVSLAEVELEIRCHDGDDTIVVRTVGHYTYIDGGGDLDDVEVRILGDPTDDSYDTLWDFLAYTAETLTVDNRGYVGAADWTIEKKNDALCVGTDPILRTDGIGQIYLIADPNGGSTLGVEEVDGRVTINGGRVDMRTLAPVLGVRPGSFVNSGYTTTLATLVGVADVATFGDFVYTASAGDSAVAVFERGEGDALELVQVLKDGFDGMETLAGACCVVVSNDGRFVYVAAPDDNAITAFDRDAVTGRLNPLQAAIDGYPIIAVSLDSFEGYRSDGWGTGGVASIETGAVGTGPTQGAHQALVTNGVGSLAYADLKPHSVYPPIRCTGWARNPSGCVPGELRLRELRWVDRRQPDRRRRLLERGGGAIFPQKKLTADRLAAALRTAVTDPEMKQRAYACAETIRAENGVENAVKIVRHYFGAPATGANE